ncbi:thermopsin family protease [Vulcanisaeta sp. JCM 16159]|uniref:thermopsin family protease n=1 Tax=Vulcanisaeta sp. JCM 16159 TaxID=1295371 RepID=UPI0006D00BDA|nr:thermopsin family protease [Vulcanisaeta sp. JCM 16159]
MGVLRVIGLVFLGLFLLALALVIGAGILFLITHTHQIQTTNQTSPQSPQYPTTGLALSQNYPAGLVYLGPNTTALTAYYCVNTAIPNTYSIQLNAQLSNGYWIQDVYSTMAYEVNGVWEPGFGEDVWSPPGNCVTESNGVISCQSSLVSLYSVVVYGATCGWLIIAIKNGIAYFGYSLDGLNAHWYYTYPVGNATIVPNLGTQLVVGGYGNGEWVNFTNANIVLALYYWNGTTWLPAPSTAYSMVARNLPPQWVNPNTANTEEAVYNAWVYWDNGRAIVSWPEPVNQTPQVPSPGFTP